MKLLLIDDHPLFREGFALLIGQTWPHVEVGQAGSLREAQALLASQGDARLVMLDLGLPDSQGLEGLARLRAQTDAPAYVVLSAQDDADTVMAAIEAGAAGFIPKTAQSALLFEALQTILGGGVYLPVSVAPAAQPALARPAESLGLSPRQVDVLRLLIEGRSNKAICRELDLAESTVKTHLAAIFRKLDANTRTQAVVAAARLGLRLTPQPV